MKISIWKNSIISLAAVAVLLLLWGLGSIFVNAEIILPSPEKVLLEIIDLFKSRIFFKDISATVIRGCYSFLLSFFLGLVTGIAAGKYAAVNSAFRPMLTVIRSTPIMSVILIAIVWFHTGTVPVFAAFLITFPVVVENCISGIRETDKLLLEMAGMYRVSPRDILIHISIPSMVPYIISGARTAIGLTWKVVVAGEVLSLPRHGVGTQLQLSQLSLETGKVFAWTVVAVVLSALSQLILSGLLYLSGKRRISSEYSIKRS